MHILVINCGSSSLKSSVIDHRTGARVGSCVVERVGQEGSRMRFNGEWEPLDAPNIEGALKIVVPRMVENLGGATITAVGHRVVHGGVAFDRPTLITPEVEKAIEDNFQIAPLHNPPNLAGIRAARSVLPDVPHIAVFDTAFHATMPRRAREYAIDHKVAEAKNYRRFGFHGISHEFVSHLAAKHMEQDVRDLRIITCHLGNGCSVAAIEYGRSVETSMGMTPLEGLVMGTRVGDLDPGLLIQMQRDGMSLDEVDAFLNRDSGLKGLSGVGNDMRDIEARAAEGDERCRLAIQVFAHRVRKYIGAYAAVMGGVDAIVFTAGIGENSEVIRHRISQRLDYMGAVLHEDLNRDAKVSHESPVFEISTRNSRVRLLVAATDESLQIAREAAKIVEARQATKGAERGIPVAVSARHIHLTQEAVEALFGPGYKLTERNPLSQPGQFACNETVTVVGPKRQLENVRILGPTRPDNQVEISRTDEFFLGLDAPVRASGDVANSPGCKLVGPHGTYEMKQGVICAWRHIHMHPDDAEYFGVSDKDVVEVAIQGTSRELIFGDVLVRVSPKYKLEMHIDTDEGNAAELSKGAEGALLSATDGNALLRRRKTRFDEVAE
ncbi:acetate/propionate family kinase [Microvenator marinus]|uniref:Acetate kinase n=1 Tax=Microvenator marinus TaxID=2600177 RepID=A0A5B8XRH2_9DELT|nr:acetate/propionate family kinase [Microvenator marinus]QED28250.1 acetate/propionate family kinase [Microvenator marinus]